MSVASGPTDLLAGVAWLAARLLSAGITAGAPLVLVGLAALTVSGRARRALGAGGCALVGALAAVALRVPLAAHLGVSALVAAAVLGVAGAVAGFALPALFPFAAAALPCAWLGGQVPLAGRAAFGAAAGALLGGLLGLAFARLVAAAVAALAGGLLLALGLLAAFGETPLARELAVRPAAVVGFALVVGIAGAVLQFSRSPEAPAARSPESPT